MNVTPLDLRQQRFRSSFRGYDRAEVAAFLTEVADDYEQARREADRLRQDVARLDALLHEHRQQEDNLRNTLLTAQKLADGIGEHAREEAQRVLREAEARADLLFEKAQMRLEDVHREIEGLKLKRRDVETTIEATMSALRNALDFVREQDQHEREDKIVLHRRRQPDARPHPFRAFEPDESGERAAQGTS